MKHAKEYHGSSMDMVADEDLRSLLQETIVKQGITHVIETGTYLGLGSTTFVSESFPSDRPPEQFVTIEVNWKSWRRAWRNLRRFPSVKAIWGRTVAVDRALKFLENDGALRNPNEYPDILIDDTKDPLRFYQNELSGALGGRPRKYRPWQFILWLFDRKYSNAGDNLLEKYLKAFKATTPLIILDSAGGIGLLEFSIVREVMQGLPYIILLDDINHLKHFRSHQHIKKDRQFKILGSSERWLLARHAG